MCLLDGLSRFNPCVAQLYSHGSQLTHGFDPPLLWHTGHNVRLSPSSLLVPSSNPNALRHTHARTQAKPLADRFSDPALNEAMRIFPYTLRITGYSRAPAAWPARPKIHFEGASCLDVAPAAMAPVADVPVQRCLSGTVQMAASGDVHWTIVRLFLIPPSPLLAFRGREAGLFAVGETDLCVCVFCFVMVDFWGRM